MITGIFLNKVTLPGGRRALHLAYIGTSDHHLLTKSSRAKRHYERMSFLTADRIDLNGDLLDGQRAEKGDWHVGLYHPAVLALYMKRAAEGCEVNYIPGNHDVRVRERATGKNLFGINIRDSSSYRAGNREMWVDHTDRCDLSAFKTETVRDFMYGIGDGALGVLQGLDSFVNMHITEDFCSASVGKATVKWVLNRALGVNKEVAAEVRRRGMDGAITAHSHMHGFLWYPRVNESVVDRVSRFFRNRRLHDDDIVLANCGSQVDKHPQCFAIDHQGREAGLVTKKTGIKAIYADGTSEFATWAELGIEEANEPVEIEQGKYLDQAYRALRLFYRLYPPRDRKEQLAQFHEHFGLAAEFAANVANDPGDWVSDARAEMHRKQGAEALRLPLPPAYALKKRTAFEPA